MKSGKLILQPPSLRCVGQGWRRISTEMLSVLGCSDFIEPVLIEEAIDGKHRKHTGAHSQTPTLSSLVSA